MSSVLPACAGGAGRGVCARGAAPIATASAEIRTTRFIRKPPIERASVGGDGGTGSQKRSNEAKGKNVEDNLSRDVTHIGNGAPAYGRRSGVVRIPKTHAATNRLAACVFGIPTTPAAQSAAPLPM